MTLYCYWDTLNPHGEGNLICEEIPDIELPPEEPEEAEDDPNGEITLPDGTVIDATALTSPFSGIKQIAFQSHPWPVVWMVRTDGLLVSLTYDKIEDVWAPARHPMTNAAVLSVAVIPSATSDQDEVWLAVQREIGEDTRVFVERMSPRVIPASLTEKSDYNFLDCSLAYSGAATDTFTGATHLASQTVRAWADGVDVPEVEVDGAGAFTLPFEAAEVKLGIHTDAMAISLPTAPLATERQSVSQLAIEFTRTLGGKVKRQDQEDRLVFREVTGEMDDSPMLWDGLYVITLGGGHDDAGIYSIIQDTPGPMTIRAVTPTYNA